ncbi:MAG TPA: PEP/pyruvate-binding domain-containing protein, partial [Conexibacter sp.]|nr:PEP/pyruvate-binding domain-containing protein [Conexibacter sp.]
MSAGRASAHVAPLAALAAADERRFGGKSTSLGALIAAEIPVPPGFAVATSAFEEFLTGDGLAERVDEALAGLDVEDVEALASVSRTVVAAMRATPVPAGVRDELQQAYAELAAQAGEAAPPVAVRSSARGEDSADATFAGQQE